MLLLRMYRAARLDRTVYEELRTDPMAIAQGITVVILVTLALIIGAFIHEVGSGGNILKAFAMLFPMPMLWFLQALSGYVLGSMAIPQEGRQTMARPLISAIALSASPGMLFLFVGLPVPDPFLVIALPVTLWMVVTMVVAVQSTLNISGFRATMAVLPGFMIRIMLGPLISGGA